MADEILVRRELELEQLGVQFMNIELQKAFPDKTIDQIKSRQRIVKYRATRDRLRNELDADEGDGSEGDRCAVEINSPAGGGVKDEEEFDYERTIKGFLLTRPEFACEKFRSRNLNRICAHVNIWSGERLCREIVSYIVDVFPTPQAGPAKAGRGGPQEYRTKRLARRAEYAKSQ